MKIDLQPVWYWPVRWALDLLRKVENLRRESKREGVEL